MSTVASKVESGRSLKLKAVVILMQVSSAVAALALLGILSARAIGFIEERWGHWRAEALTYLWDVLPERPGVVQSADAELLSTEQLIAMYASRAGVSKLVVLAMALQESGDLTRADRIRFEPRLWERRIFPRQPWMLNEEEWRTLYSSWGVLQVIPGWHAKRCGLTSYADLLDRRINIECGVKVLSDCLAQSKAPSKAERIKDALTCYNGSEEYARQVLRRVGELLIEESV